MGMQTLCSFWGGEGGATAIEYGLIAALVVLVMLLGLQVFADAMNAMYSDSDGSLTATIRDAGGS